METPQELEVWYVIPALRKELTLAMKLSGEKQVLIANKLGITKSAVTQYLNNKRGAKELNFNERVKNEIQTSASKIKNKFDAMREIQHLLNVTRQERLVCQLHRVTDKEFSNCDVCFNNIEAK